jgi:hypothetical protein
MRSRKAIGLIFLGLLLLALAPPADAMHPCANQLWPRFFYSGFDNGNTEGFIFVPPTGWQADVPHNCLASLDTGCQSWVRAWLMDGFLWTDYILQASVQYLSGTCNQLGLTYRMRDQNNFYLFVLQDGTTASLIRYTNNVPDRTLSVPYAYLPDRWYVLRVQVAGPLHTACVNGVPVLSWTDNSILQGSGGLVAKGTHGWFDGVFVIVQPPLPPPLAQHNHGEATGEN